MIKLAGINPITGEVAFEQYFKSYKDAKEKETQLTGSGLMIQLTPVSDAQFQSLGADITKKLVDLYGSNVLN